MSRLPHDALSEAIPQIPFAWLRDRRWFSSKGRALESLTVADWGALPLDESGIIALTVARYTTGRDEQYFLPLIAMTQEQPEGVRTPPALHLAHDGATWYLHDAFQFNSFQRLLMERLIAGGEVAMHGGRIVFSPEDALRESPPPLQQIKLVTAEQSNSSIIYDRQAILKVFRRVVAGVNPDVEVSRFLGRAGFKHTPAMLGSISYISTDGVEHSLGLLQSFAPNEGDAWERTLKQLESFLGSVPQAESGDTLAVETQGRAEQQLSEIRELGGLTGEMHRALASDSHDPDFAPRPLTAEQVTAWQEDIRKGAAILDELERRASDLPAEQRESVEALLTARSRIDRRIDDLVALGDANVVTTRFHGDYHLGQVLVSDQGFLILDFEGEPLRRLEERRAHSSPLKDVAGMLRSLSYAAQTALRGAGESQEQARPWIEEWEQQARTHFLYGYLDAARNAPFLPQESELLRAAIAVFELEKALYELNYELNNRPDWLPIPLQGIQRVI